MVSDFCLCATTEIVATTVATVKSPKSLEQPLQGVRRKVDLSFAVQRVTKGVCFFYLT